jgi:6,7-dimethyl-8-ribityllumazine synthase
MYEPIETKIDAKGLRVGLAVSSYHQQVTAAMRDGAVSRFVDAGGQPADLLVAPAPGAFELVVISSALAARGDLDAIVALGCVVTGETTHDRYICDAVANGLASICADGIPIGFGLLTCQTIEQAHARAGGDKGNKGADAMAAIIQTVNTLRAIGVA